MQCNATSLRVLKRQVSQAKMKHLNRTVRGVMAGRVWLTSTPGLALPLFTILNFLAHETCNPPYGG
jgi:hypothetical protein